jgi:Xaa-Pro aminopeptidase
MSYRLENLRGKLQDKGLDSLLVSTPENRRYLSGFTGSAGYLVISSDLAILATDFRYVEQAGNQCPDFQVVKTGSDWSWLLDLQREHRMKKLGFEGQHMTVATYRQLSEASQELPSVDKPDLISTSGMVEELRTVKDTDELALLQKAIDVADAAMQAISATLKVGDTEKEVAWQLEKAMRDFGADSLSFDTIVAAGPNGAMPHHRPSDRPIALREPVVIDMGAMVGGYCSDITRTFCVGEPDEMFRKVYDIVLGSQLAAIATVRAGMSGGEADELSRVVISEAGYGDNFGHSLGHGVGMAVHEYPRVGPKSGHHLEEGMVFTVEPGIYLSGWGGVRIEDVVILDNSGAQVLSKAPK